MKMKLSEQLLDKITWNGKCAEKKVYILRERLIFRILSRQKIQTAE